MVAILTDKSYADSLWSKQLFSSLTECLRSRRIPFCQIEDSCPAQCDTVFIITSDYAWTSSTVRQLNKSGRIPILLCNQYENLPGCVYSCVCSDVNSSMKNLLESLLEEDRKRICMFGMNPSSISDISRTNSLFSWRSDDMDAIQVFLNNGSLSNCFDGFYERIRDFDAVICSNDFAAIFLVRKLRTLAPEQLERLRIISCAESELSNFYRQHIDTLHVNFEQYGRAAVYIYESLRKRPYLSGMILHVAPSFRKNAPEAIPAETKLKLERQVDSFYTDPDLREMLIADHLLSAADQADSIILDGLSSGQSYDEIAENCFLAEGSIKYRIKRLLSDCGASSRDEMIRIYQKYTK